MEVEIFLIVGTLPLQREKEIDLNIEETRSGKERNHGIVILVIGPIKS